MLFGCDCFWWKKKNQELEFNHTVVKPETFSLPSPIPNWPQGSGFSSGRIGLGDLEVAKVTNFESIWSCSLLQGNKSKGVTFYKPAEIPDGFFCLGHYCQPDNQPLRGYVLVARETENGYSNDSPSPALRKPLSYSLIWGTDSYHNGYGYFWLPNAPGGYKAMGIFVTDKPVQPELEEVRCVREDLTESCEACDVIISTESSSKYPFHVWNTRPSDRGMMAKGVSVGTFFSGTTRLNPEDELDIACLKNLDCSFHAMPNLDQVHALIKEYGPTLFFHPDEEYLPSSVPWFFKNGALLYHDGKSKGERIDYKGSILPIGGENDGEYWIDLPKDDESRDFLKKGDLESALLYIHVKPTLGGTFTDIAMWVFCPFNGPATLKVGLMSVPMNKIGEHVGDWEHYTLRVSNFNGELWQMFFSEHSGGRWVNAYELEFIADNKAVVYSSKNGHASYAHAGVYLQGSSKVGIGLRNDTARSKFYIDSSIEYEIVAAEYLGDGSGVEEPCWLDFMKEWGPTIRYDSRSELEKVINVLPLFVRFSVENIFHLFPTELYGEEGPTGPKEKRNWLGDEIC